MKTHSISTSRTEMILGLVCILLQVFILPIALVAINSILQQPFTMSQMNFLNFALNFIIVTVCFHQFLLASIKEFIQNAGKNFSICFKGFCLYWLASILTNILVVYLDPEFTNVNDDNIATLTQDNYLLMCVGTILLVPLAEETLYRGVIFGNLYQRNPAIAYIASVTIFAFLHVLGYIGQYSIFRLLLCFLQYIPAAIVLALTYAKSNTIFVPILIHMLVNTIGMISLQ